MMNNNEGTIKREKMLSNFSTMIKPARLITNLSQEKLAEMSGLSIELIIGVENGMHRFHEEHYLALAAVFDNMKYTEDSSIYKAMLRILTPEGEIFEISDDNDFILVKRWFDTFSEDNNINNERTCDSFLEDLAEDYSIYVETSAAEDENFPALLSRLEPFLCQSEKKILVPSTVINELKEDIENSEEAEEKLNLTEALEFLDIKKNEGLIKIRDCPQIFEDTEEVLHSMIANESEYNKIAVITQDPGVAQILMSYHENIISAHINDTGDLILWR